MEIGQHFEQFFVRFINTTNQIAHFVFLEVFSEGLQTVGHKLVDFDGVVVFVASVNSQA